MRRAPRLEAPRASGKVGIWAAAVALATSYLLISAAAAFTPSGPGNPPPVPPPEPPPGSNGGGGGSGGGGGGAGGSGGSGGSAGDPASPLPAGPQESGEGEGEAWYYPPPSGNSSASHKPTDEPSPQPFGPEQAEDTSPDAAGGLGAVSGQDAGCHAGAAALPGWLLALAALAGLALRRRR